MASTHKTPLAQVNYQGANNFFQKSEVYDSCNSLFDNPTANTPWTNQRETIVQEKKKDR